MAKTHGGGIRLLLTMTGVYSSSSTLTIIYLITSIRLCIDIYNFIITFSFSFIYTCNTSSPLTIIYYTNRLPSYKYIIIFIFFFTFTYNTNNVNTNGIICNTSSTLTIIYSIFTIWTFIGIYSFIITFIIIFIIIFIINLSIFWIYTYNTSFSYIITYNTSFSITIISFIFINFNFTITIIIYFSTIKINIKININNTIFINIYSSSITYYFISIII